MTNTAVVAWVVASLVACGSGNRGSTETGSDRAAGDQPPRTPERCAAVDYPPLAKTTFTAGDARWTIADHRAVIERADLKSHNPTIAVIGDAGGAAKPTVAAISELASAIGSVDVIIALGGMAAREADLVAVLGPLAARAVVVALPGDLESVAALRAAIAKLSTTTQHVLDGSALRRLDIGSLSLVMVAGARTSERLVAGAGGCIYDDAQVAALYQSIAGNAGLRVAATSEAPRMIADGDPVGELALVPAPGAIDVVIHGPIVDPPTPARDGQRDGAATPVSPGICDATPRLSPRHPPSAAVFTVTGTAWRWRPIVLAQ